MARYIDAEKLANDINVLESFELNDDEKCIVFNTIRQQPTADVVEVNNAILAVLQIALEEIRKYRKEVGHDPVFYFSQEETNQIADYARELLNGRSNDE